MFVLRTAYTTVGVLTACFLLAAGNFAHGQEAATFLTGEDSAATDTTEPPLATRKTPAVEDAPVLRAGVFEFIPKIDVAAVHTDNVALTSSQETSAAGLKLASHLQLRTDWVRHAFQVAAAGERIDYGDHPEAATSEGEFKGAFRIDIRHDTTAKVELLASQTQSSAIDSDVPDSAIGKRNDYEYGLLAELGRSSGRFQARAGLGVSRFSYSDVSLKGGGSADNSDLNYVEPEAVFEASYQTRSKVRPTAGVEISSRLHDLKTDESGLRRDSFALSVKAGASFEDGDIWSGTAGIQYDVRQYEDSSLDDYSGIGLFLDASWRPSELTTIQVSVEPGSTSRSAEISIIHELRDHIVAQMQGSAEYSTTDGSDDRSLTFEWGGEISYRLNRTFSLIAGFDYTRYMLLDDSGGYRETQVTAGLRLGR